MAEFTVEKDWTTKAGYRAIAGVVRDSHRTGYVALPMEHPLAGKDCDIPNVNVHGGLTFAEDGSGDYPVPCKHVWWFGFDCAHCGDALMYPGYKSCGAEEVRSLDYVVAECESLARQLLALSN